MPQVIRADFPTERCGDFYARELAVCVNCRTAWEPIDPSQIWDPSDALCSFREPCDNCAFQPGSPKQRDPEHWRELMAGLKGGASFYCHKGVPLDPGGKHGFAYPSNPAKLRLCHGYLNMLGRQRGGEEAEQADAA